MLYKRGGFLLGKRAAPIAESFLTEDNKENKGFVLCALRKSSFSSFPSVKNPNSIRKNLRCLRFPL